MANDEENLAKEEEAGDEQKADMISVREKKTQIYNELIRQKIEKYPMYK